MMEIIVVISLVIGLTCFFGLIRNYRVYNILKEKLDEVARLAHLDVDKNLEWEWRFEQLRQISYVEMVFCFWKPLNSWFEGVEFLKETR